MNDNTPRTPGSPDPGWSNDVERWPIGTEWLDHILVRNKNSQVLSGRVKKDLMGGSSDHLAVRGEYQFSRMTLRS